MHRKIEKIIEYLLKITVVLCYTCFNNKREGGTVVHKYYVEGAYNRFNLSFYSSTSREGILHLPEICCSLREAISAAVYEDEEFECIMKGYKQYLYLEKSEDTKRYWKVIVGIWLNKEEFDKCMPPIRVVRLSTDSFCELLRHKETGKYYEELPLSVCRDSNIRMFY